MHTPITIERTSHSRIESVNFEELPFGKIFSDHMFVMDYADGTWQEGKIVPFGPISIHPATSALHYGQAIFEGLKAYHLQQGTIGIFRPDQNIKRLNRSAMRMAMPTIDESFLLQAIHDLIWLDRKWIPKSKTGSLYIRPYMFATDEYVGIRPSEHFKFIIFTCPVEAYYSQPVNVLISDEYVRAFKGGIGTAKAAGNYAATLYPVKLAREKGYDQILWMDGAEFTYFHEIGTMNVFFQVDDVFLTPTLDEGAILEGVTRASILQLMKDQGYKVEERRISIHEILNAHENGRLRDAFGTGTAATLSHIAKMGYKGKDYILPPLETRKLSLALQEELQNIKKGVVEDRHHWIYSVGEKVAAMK